MNEILARIHAHICGEERQDEIRVRNKELFEKLRKLGANRSNCWRIGKEIFQASEKVKKEWLRAFFDDEATIETKNRIRIRIKSVNLKGLTDIALLLKDLGIISNITGPNNDRTWYLTISNKNSLNTFRLK
jgi:intein/homing endonuclease